MTTVPSAGQPGAAYFSNGAEVTRLPLAIPTTVLTEPQSPASVEPPSWSSVPPANPTMSSATFPPAATRARGKAAPAAMTFEAWLHAVRGAPAPPPPSQGAAPVTAVYAEREAPIEEPPTRAYDARQRATYALPEKSRERAVAGERWRGLIPFVAGAFAIALLLGVLVTRRSRRRIVS